MRRRHAELEHLGAEVVDVAADAGLGVDPHVELVAALVRRRRRAHAQRVEVVGDRPVVGVAREVADREVHRRGVRRRWSCGARWRRRRSSARRGRGRRARAPAATVSQVWPISASSGERTALEVQVGGHAAQAQHRLGVARARVGGLERVVQRVDAGRDAVGVGALEQQEARDRARVRRRRAPRAGRPGSRRPPAAARAPGRSPAASSPGGNATRRIRSTMSADSM